MNNIEKIKVSIVCPVYNCGLYIRSTLESVFNQTHQNFEILIIDDCSTDNSVEIIRQNIDKRIKLFSNKQNMGAAYCRNLAIEKSSGDFIAFLDGDDLWHKEKLHKQLLFMLKHKIKFSYTNYDVVDKNGKNTGFFFTGPKTIKHKTFLKACYVGCLTVMYEKNIYPDLKIPNSILKRNDYALWLLLSEKTDCFLLDEVLASYRKAGGTSLSSGKKINLFKHHVFLFMNLYNFSRFKATLYSFRNAFYHVLKSILYKKKIRDRN